MDAIYAALGEADLFISIGASGNIYPAAGFVAEARDDETARTVELNLEPWSAPPCSPSAATPAMACPCT